MARRELGVPRHRSAEQTRLAPGLRDHTGVVHYSYDRGDVRTTLCEVHKNGSIDVVYSSAELKMTRAPVTCLTCLVHAIDDAARVRAGDE